MTLILDKDNPLRTKVQTRDGRKARIICTERDDPSFKIVALYGTAATGGEGVSCHMSDGRLGPDLDRSGDLINAPEEVELFIWDRSAQKCGIAASDFRVAGLGDSYSPGSGWQKFARIKVRKGEGL